MEASNYGLKPFKGKKIKSLDELFSPRQHKIFNEKEGLEIRHETQGFKIAGFKKHLPGFSKVIIKNVDGKTVSSTVCTAYAILGKDETTDVFTLVVSNNKSTGSVALTTTGGMNIKKYAPGIYEYFGLKSSDFKGDEPYFIEASSVEFDAATVTLTLKFEVKPVVVETNNTTEA